MWGSVAARSKPATQPTHTPTPGTSQPPDAAAPPPRTQAEAPTGTELLDSETVPHPEPPKVDHPAMDPITINRTQKGDWRDKANCAMPVPDTTHPTPNWFPQPGHATDRTTKMAIAICQLCPVQRECLTYALVNDRSADRGIYGGLTPKQRKTLKAEMRATGTFPEIRRCAQCSTLFAAASPVVVRQGAVCSEECRRARKRVWDRLHRPSGYARRRQAAR